MRRAPVVLQSIVYAAILILIMLFMPRGLLPGIQQFVARLIARIRGTQITDARQNETPVSELADG